MSEADRRGDLEVWNRTEAMVEIVTLDSMRFEVPACGHLAEQDVILNRLVFRDAEGRFFTEFGGGGEHEYLIVRLNDPLGWVRGLASPPSDPLPPCEGVIEGQPGTESATP